MSGGAAFIILNGSRRRRQARHPYASIEPQPEHPGETDTEWFEQWWKSKRPELSREAARRIWDREIR